MASLRSKLDVYRRQQHTSSTREVREPWLIDGDLGDELAALHKARTAMTERHARQRARLVPDEDDERMAGPDLSMRDETDAAELARLDERIAAVEADAKDQTVFLVFRAISSPRYDELYHAATLAAALPGASRAVESELASRLASACWVGAETDGVLDRAQTWDDLKALTDSEDDFGAPLMTPGFVDHVEMLVLALNRTVPAVPFSLRPSGRTATH